MVRVLRVECVGCNTSCVGCEKSVRVSSSVSCGSRLSGTNLPRLLGRLVRHEEVRGVQAVFAFGARVHILSGCDPDASVLNFDALLRRFEVVDMSRRPRLALPVEEDGKRFGGRGRGACVRVEG